VALTLIHLIGTTQPTPVPILVEVDAMKVGVKLGKPAITTDGPSQGGPSAKQTDKF
jgi:hypothetical protein